MDKLNEKILELYQNLKIVENNKIDYKAKEIKENIEILELLVEIPKTLQN